MVFINHTNVWYAKIPSSWLYIPCELQQNERYDIADIAYVATSLSFVFVFYFVTFTWPRNER